ncbi:MAG: mannose-1-phosphate guanylyltransferase/mannose-6-phosphate isomerase [Pseudohongiellaceae bacterium]|jgi:mannose-1-phosphate guanylyltransferase/mannose-6-phosphate isomerase
MVIPVVLSGGSGTRLWPLSRKMHPKQLLPLIGDTTLLQATLNRLESVDSITDPIVICNDDYRFLVAEQIKHTVFPQSEIILEPFGRDTAPAIALAAFSAMQKEEDPTLLILPADHDIKNIKGFRETIALGRQQAEQGWLVTFGIVPTSAETGYGYIKAGPAINSGGCCKVERFVEKPDRKTAEQYVKEGDFYWNSGMFMFKATTYLEALKTHNAKMYNACVKAHEASERDLTFLRIDSKAFESCPADSIDYAVLEKSENVAVIPADIGWSDIGSWSALHDLHQGDADNNVIIGDVKISDTKNCYIRSNKKLTVGLGIKDLIIIDTADALLVAHRDKVQDIKPIVESLKEEGRTEVDIHKKVYRPWGAYQGIDEAERFQVKRITVNSGQILSLQMHHHRAEHWIVVSGTAKVTRGEEDFIVAENESTYIPLGVKHRLENIGKIPLQLIEVQTGSYLGEDDIVRFDDVYGRSAT